MPSIETYLGEAVKELIEFKDRVQVLIDTCTSINSKEIAVSASEFTSVAKILEKLLSGTQLKSLFHLLDKTNIKKAQSLSVSRLSSLSKLVDPPLHFNLDTPSTIDVFAKSGDLLMFWLGNRSLNLSLGYRLTINGSSI